MKPNDLIEWYYKDCNKVVYKNEELWSTVIDDWVPIGIVSMLLHRNNETYSWINSKGIFQACLKDIMVKSQWPMVPAGVSIRTWKQD